MAGQESAERQWQAVLGERDRLAGFDLRTAFGQDPERAARMRLEAAGLVLDYSRQLLDEGALAALEKLAIACDVAGRLRSQFAGEPVNLTEARPALHTLLRGGDAALPQAAAVREARDRLEAIALRVREGRWSGWSGEPVAAVVNIGIGGSHLGPCLVAEALAAGRTGGIALRFVSNVDPCDIEDALAGLDPRRTLFVVASKTFGTLETLENARAARRWLIDAGCPEPSLACHFAAVSANTARAAAFGVAPQNVLPMWDWVGGRYSLWSAIGLPVAIGIGPAAFGELLDGARRMDEHAAEAPVRRNMPVLMALLSVWNRNALGASSVAVVPYAQRLARLPEYLQQLVMESNGKSVRRDGRPVQRATSGVLWGAPGTNGQHSFHQLLHQGTERVPVEFVVPLATDAHGRAQHAHLVANALAQAQALMHGRDIEAARAALAARGAGPAEVERLAPHLVMPGNRPSSTLCFASLTPAALGALLALYEHRTAAEAALWDINAFDQYGVELGKELGEAVHRALGGERGAEGALDGATRLQVEAWRAAQAAWGEG